MKTTVTFKLAFAGGDSYLNPSGYSKYDERLGLAHKGEMEHDEVYGREQAEDHAKEYYGVQDEHTERRSLTVLELVRTISIVETLDTFSVKPLRSKVPAEQVNEETAPRLFAKGDLVQSFTGNTFHPTKSKTYDLIVMSDQRPSHKYVHCRTLDDRDNEYADQFINPLNLRHARISK